MASRNSQYPPPRKDHTTPGFSNSPPSQLIPVDESVAIQLRRLYDTDLTESEVIWRDRYSFLLKHGLELRFRYKPGWTASWLRANIDPACCDDSIEQTVRSLAIINQSTYKREKYSYRCYWTQKGR